MKNKERIIIIILLINFFSVFSQSKATDSGGEIEITSPTLFLVPQVKEGEDIRKIIEGDNDLQVVFSVIKQAFDKRGFTCSNYIDEVKITNKSSAINTSKQSNSQSDIVRNSGKDIAVYVKLNKKNKGTENALSIILEANEISTNSSIANVNGDSGYFETSDFELLAKRALSFTPSTSDDEIKISIIEDFLNVIQSKFTERLKNGNVIRIVIQIGTNCKVNFSTEIDGLPLEDKIREWMAANAYKNNFSTKGTSELVMEFDKVRIPVLNQATKTNYKAGDFALELWKYLKSLGLTPNKTTTNNLVTIILK